MLLLYIIKGLIFFVLLYSKLYFNKASGRKLDMRISLIYKRVFFPGPQNYLHLFLQDAGQAVGFVLSYD